VQYSSSLHQSGRSCITVLLIIIFSAAAYGADTYNSATRQLSIPALGVGNATFSSIVVTVGNVVNGQTGNTPIGSEDTYNPSNNQLTVPSVMVGTSTYYNAIGTVRSLDSIGSVIGADVYDGTNLTIPYVQVVGGSSFNNVVITVGNVLRVGTGMPTLAMDSYNSATGELAIPIVQVSSRVYTNVIVQVGKVISSGGGELPPPTPNPASVSCPTSPTQTNSSACISVLDGVPRLIVNSQPTPPLMFFGNIEASARQYPLLTQEIQMAAVSGIHLYKFTTDVPWTGTNYAYDDAFLGFYAAADPSALILMEINMDVVDELGTFTVPAGNDNLFQNGSTTPISLASDFYFSAYQVAIQNAINHFESGPYASRIIGYWIGSGPNTTEWFPDQYRELGLDYSPVNLTAFRQWLQSKYSTDAALSAAWGQPVTLATAAIPAPVAGRFPMHGALQGEAIDAFYSLPTQQNWVDYSDYISHLITNRILALANAAKVTMQGRKLVGVYFGYAFDLPGSMNGHADPTPLLDSPDIDMFGAPVSYIPVTERLAGGAGGFMSAIDSIALHGKLWINEDDLDTWLAAASGLPVIGFNGGAPTAGLSDTNGVLMRNLGDELVHRAGEYWMDLSADGAFNDASLWLTMSQYGIPLYRDVNANPVPYMPDVAVLVGERSVLYQGSDWDFLNSARALLRNAIVKTGTTVGFYYLSDFLDGTLPPTKVYLFANAGYLTDTEVSQIRTRLGDEGATAIWQHAPGFLGGSSSGAAGSSALTGIIVSQIDGYPGTTGVGELNGLAWGFGSGGQNVLSPRLVVTDASAEALGVWSTDQTVNSARKSTGGFQSVLLGDFALGNPDMLRKLLSDAGAHIWIQTDDVLFSDSRNVFIHAASSGPKVIYLPASLVDAATGLNTITVSMQLGDTFWFKLKRIGVPGISLRSVDLMPAR
jgi:hypothetical protein